MSDVPPPPPPTPPAQPPVPGPPPGGGAQPFDVGAAFSWGWKKLQENIGPILIAMLIYVVVIAVVEFVAYFILGGILISSASIDPNTGQISGGSGLIAGLFFAALVSGVGIVLFAFLQAAIVRGGLMIADGQRLQVGQMFNFENFGTVFLAALIVAALTVVGVFLCYIGAIAVAIFTPFYMFFVIDKGAGPWESVVASFNEVKNHFGSVFLLLLALYAVNFLGALLCGIGLIVTLPLTFLALTFAYRRLQGDPIAA
jgi:uncharacterized membrane protein